MHLRKIIESLSEKQGYLYRYIELDDFFLLEISLFTVKINSVLKDLLNNFDWKNSVPTLVSFVSLLSIVSTCTGHWQLLAEKI